MDVSVWDKNINIYKNLDRGFPGGSDGKASACIAGDLGSIPGLGKSPRERNGNPFPVLLPGKFHGWRSLVGYSPWGRKELDMTEQLHWFTGVDTCVHTCTHAHVYISTESLETVTPQWQ